MNRLSKYLSIFGGRATSRSLHDPDMIVIQNLSRFVQQMVSVSYIECKFGKGKSVAAERFLSADWYAANENASPFVDKWKMDAPGKILSRLSLVAGLFLKPDQVDDFLELQAAQYKDRLKRDGKFWASAYDISESSNHWDHSWPGLCTELSLETPYGGF